MALQSFDKLTNYNIYYYDKVFYPNACHVCKTTDQEKLKTCFKCHMITYCSEVHRIMHQPEHQEICEAIRRISKTTDLWNSHGMSSDEWVEFKKENMRRIKQELCRNLEPYEEQMFLFAKSCFICHQQSNLFNICKGCYCINSCIDHNLANIKHNCEGLLLSYILDVEYLQHKEVITSKLFHYKISMCKFPINIESFVTRFGSDVARNYRFWSPFDYYFCDWVSEPLTVCQIIQNPRYFYFTKLPSFTVHIIASSNNTNNWLAWELLLHMLADKVSLQIIVLGSELQNIDMPALRLCDTCISLGKSLSIKLCNESYKQYMLASGDNADIIVGFNVELKNFENSTINTLRHQNRPLLLTSTSKDKTNDNLRILNESKVMFTVPHIRAKNSFRSYRPYRDYEIDRVFLRNKYLIICERPNFQPIQAKSNSRV